MHPTTYHELAHMHQSELLREAQNARLAKQAKAATASDKTNLFGGVREAVSSLMQALKPTKSGSITTVRTSSI